MAVFCVFISADRGAFFIAKKPSITRGRQCMYTWLSVTGFFAPLRAQNDVSASHPTAYCLLLTFE